jgi:hypothetical protein
MAKVQYIIDNKNNVTGVIVPIDLWRKIQEHKKELNLFKSGRKKHPEEETGFFRGLDKF